MFPEEFIEKKKNHSQTHILIWYRSVSHIIPIKLDTSYVQFIGLIIHSHVSCLGTVSAGAIHVEGVVCKDESTPIVVVIPGLTSDSSSAVSLYYQFACILNVVVTSLTIQLSWNLETTTYLALPCEQLIDCLLRACKLSSLCLGRW